MDTNATTQRRPEVTVLSHIAPSRRVTHAGGLYVLEEARVLCDRVSAVIFAPMTEDNAQAGADRWADSIDVQVVPPGRSLWENVVQRVQAVLDPFGWPVATGFSRAVVRNDAVAQRLRESDIVEIQWLEYFRLVGFVRRTAPNARIVGFAPDITSQRIHRLMTNSGNPIVRLCANSVRSANRARERRWFSALDTAIVLSEKDADLLRELNPTCRIEVVYPNLEEPEMADLDYARRVEGKEVVFVGVFSRPENDSAAVALIDRMWPKVVEKHPDARLTVVGRDPSDRMRAAARNHPSVTITGRVESIVPYYLSANCAVVPLVYGAGVKFKTVSAMLWGVPIVSTHVGTEGIGPDEFFYDVSDTEDGLVDGMVRCLADSEARSDAQGARRWACERYSAAAFRSRIETIFARP